VVDLPQCPLATEPVNRAIEAFRSSDAWRTVRDGTDVVFREISPAKAGWWSRQIPGGTLPSILIEDTACGPLRVPRNAFFQVNASMAPKLIETVCKWFEDGAAEMPEIIDGYCGVGVLGLSCMKHGGKRLVGIESSRSSVEAARQNARMWEVPAEFRCVSLGEEPFAIKSCIGNRAKTTLVLDPPRGGMSPNWTDQVVKSGIPRVFYVSCDPATLARDLRILVDGGYELKRVQLLDLFPRTARFETVTELHIVE
jgi:23S rRNA (uracil1939-C5)-methyltransferase